MAYPRLSIVLASGARIGPGKTRLLESIRRRSDHPDPAVRLWRSDQGGRLPSLLVSLPTVAVGLARHVRLGALDRPVLRTVVVPMALGSVLGAAAGGLMVGLVPPAPLKVALGLVLVWSAWRTFRHVRPTA
ncbi:MAG: TSUP family transporter [Alphaproteobacteria bacterium]